MNSYIRPPRLFTPVALAAALISCGRNQSSSKTPSPRSPDESPSAQAGAATSAAPSSKPAAEPIEVPPAP